VNKTSVTPSVSLTHSAHTWRVRAYAVGKWYAWSANCSFTVASPMPVPDYPKNIIYETKPTYNWS